MQTKATSEADRVDYCRRECGFWLAPGPSGALWVFVPCGQDPNDGAPLSHTRMATPREADCWRRGRLGEIARVLQAQGLPVRAPAPWWKRLLGRG
jgi:hypothetical protein